MPEPSDIISKTFATITDLIQSWADTCSRERFDRIMRQGLEIKIESGSDGNPQINVKIIRPGLL
jgi:hypothetical protein